MQTEHQRVRWVDTAKGIGIILIVLWHSPSNIIAEPYMLWVKACAVPLFFFLSGFFIRTSENLTDVIKNKSRTILFPYLATSAIAILGSSLKSGGMPGPEDFAGTAYGSFHYLEWGPLWFLPHLFIISILGHTILKNARLEPLLLILTILPLALSNIYYLDHIWLVDLTPFVPAPIKGWPFSADIIFISLFFYTLGYICYPLLRDADRKILWTFMLLIFGLNFLLNDNAMDLALRRYDHMFFSTFYAISGIFFLVAVSNILSMTSITLGPLSAIGRDTLCILLFHEVIQRRFYNYAEGMGWSPLESALIAFTLALILPILLRTVILSRVKFLSMAFNCVYRPLNLKRGDTPDLRSM